MKAENGTFIQNNFVFRFNIFSFEKNSLDFYIKNVTDHREIINVLGIRNSSVFLSNCVIWVEGVSDRIYLKKFLQMYLKYKNIEFKEDYHFAFSEYGGSNIENFEFIDSGERDESKVKVESIYK